ncbi:MAG: FecR domain-containing protein [Puia sp.]|nr:FecR domain-containing protein [Puia sp.]
MNTRDTENALKISELLKKRLLDPDSSELLSAAEEDALREWLKKSPAHQELLDRIKKEGITEEDRALIEYFEDFNERDLVKMEAARADLQEATVPSIPRWLNRRTWWAAASIALIITVAAGYFYYQYRSAQTLAHVDRQAADDILPGGDVATLTLANGKKIALDSSGQGQLATQGQVRIVKSGKGMISYIGGGLASGNKTDPSLNDEPIVFNTITTPKKGKFQVVLPDGSRVWLNASSSLTYPTRFVGPDRRVTLTGEGYFEVSHPGMFGSHPDGTPPFIVNAGKTRIEVLGTHFDVSAYGDDPTLNTTLVEGKVRVNAGLTSIVIRPGEQAQTTPESEVMTKTVDTTSVIAWKEGSFRFNDLDLESAFRQIARWYDVEVEFQGDVRNKTVWAKISRNTRLSLLIDALSSAEIHCKLVEKNQRPTIIVFP